MAASIGPVIIDLMSFTLSVEERELLQHPLVGGVILFTRNFENPGQLKALCQTIRAARTTPLLIAVDQEGGRVQRFREGLISIPPMGDLGRLYDSNEKEALLSAEEYGLIMASELLSLGLDLSFAPVLDLNKDLNNAVVGDRAFHRQPKSVIALASALIKGMNKAGMAATGKHFPGHGSVSIDSHQDMPIDHRDFQTVLQDDLIPFTHFIQQGINAIMAAHILFPEIDDKPVGFSRRWLKEILKHQLHFKGMIFSDDLNMEGASKMGGYPERALTALDAGCDMILICNNRSGAINILDRLPQTFYVDPTKFNLMRGRVFT